MSGKTMLAVVTVIAASATARDATAQECKVVTARPDGSVVVEIDKKQYLALTDEQQKNVLKLQANLDAANAQLAEKDRLIASYEKVLAQARTANQDLREYTAELEVVQKGYKDLVAAYKGLKEPWLTLEGGLGITGKDTNPAVVVGLGVRAFRAWAFLQKDNAGGAVGLSLPVF